MEICFKARTRHFQVRLQADCLHQDFIPAYAEASCGCLETPKDHLGVPLFLRYMSDLLPLRMMSVCDRVFFLLEQRNYLTAVYTHSLLSLLEDIKNEKHALGGMIHPKTERRISSALDFRDPQHTLLQ